MEIYVKYLLFSYFSLFFWFSTHILSDAKLLPVSQLKTRHKLGHT